MVTITKRWIAIELTIQGEYRFKILIYGKLSICEEPTEIDARVVEQNYENQFYDWIYSDSILIHDSENGEKSWSLGVSKKGYEIWLE